MSFRHSCFAFLMLKRKKKNSAGKIHIFIGWELILAFCGERQEFHSRVAAALFAGGEILSACREATTKIVCQ